MNGDPDLTILRVTETKMKMWMAPHPLAPSLVDWFWMPWVFETIEIGNHNWIWIAELIDLIRENVGWVVSGDLIPSWDYTTMWIPRARLKAFLFFESDAFVRPLVLVGTSPCNETTFSHWEIPLNKTLNDDCALEWTLESEFPSRNDKDGFQDGDWTGLLSKVLDR